MTKTRLSSDTAVDAEKLGSLQQDIKISDEHIENPLLIPDYRPGTDEERRLVWKIDLCLLPIIFVMYFLSYMDRINVGNAKVAGMEEYLNLSSGQYSIVLVIMIVFYVSAEIPLNMILSRSKPYIFMPIIMILWGCVTAAMTRIETYHQLLGCRVVVGMCEAGFAPGVLLMFSSWYKRSEQSMRFGIYISAPVISGAFGGLLSGAIMSGLDGAHGIAGWRWLFLIEGVLTVGVAALSAFILLGFPANSRYLSERERALAVTRLQYDSIVNNKPNEAQMTHWEAFKFAATNWRVWLMTLGYFIITGTSSMSYFYPTLVQSLGYTGTKIQYMTVPIYAVAFVFNLATSFIGDRKLRPYRGYINMFWLIILTICAVVVTACYNTKVRYTFLVFMTAAVWSSTAATLAYGSSTYAYMDREARAVALAIQNGVGTAATIYGAFLFPASDKPKYTMGFSVISALSFLGIFVFLALQILLPSEAWRYTGQFSRYNRLKGMFPGLGLGTGLFIAYCAFEQLVGFGDSHH
ncbi:major facilitator superfamily domain-containing protein [Myxozyma melibiosi]|uniref:Major facilitator superfamily domain-containing protein n=1 Tax=Myxozyma melibiosi TaxID=54550 RepID=A0ABR1F271_9ASCO